jgi:hypothetical protein
MDMGAQMTTTDMLRNLAHAILDMASYRADGARQLATHVITSLDDLARSGTRPEAPTPPDSGRTTAGQSGSQDQIEESAGKASRGTDKNGQRKPQLTPAATTGAPTGTGGDADSSSSKVLSKKHIEGLRGCRHTGWGVVEKVSLLASHEKLRRQVEEATNLLAEAEVDRFGNAIPAISDFLDRTDPQREGGV